MHLGTILTVYAGFLCSASAFPNAPFYTDDRWIKDSTGAPFTYAGVNWPGAAETMLPEGLQYQSIQFIVDKIKNAGFNSIRLTFAIQLVDQIFDNNGQDVPISTAFTNALGQENGTKIFNQVLANNPTFTPETTRMQVFDAIAAECNNQGIYVHLDNHMSKAGWCCSFTDGNGWFGDTDFDVNNWARGLTYMVSHASNWPNFVSIGLRNELRPPLDKPLLAVGHYNWADWYNNMRIGADAVHAGNPNALIFLGGINSDTTLYPIPTGSTFGSGISFDLNSFSYKNKLVLELHNYDTQVTPVITCDLLEAALYIDGFNALNEQDPLIKNVMPVVMTEFGYAQDANSVNSVYATCLRKYLPSQKAGWMVWVMAGSHYIRSGEQDSDETYGILNHDWSDYRNAAVFNAGVGQLIEDSLAAQ